MSFHVGCTHAGTRVTSWLHACFRSTCRSIEFPIVTLRSYREIRSVRTRPLFQIYQELRGKRREDRCRGYDGGDPQVAVEKLLEFLFNWEMCGGRGINFGTKMQRKLNFFIRTHGGNEMNGTTRFLFGIIEENRIEIWRVAEKERNDRLALKVSWLSIALMGEELSKVKVDDAQISTLRICEVFESENEKLSNGEGYFKNTRFYNVSINDIVSPLLIRLFCGR